MIKQLSLLYDKQVSLLSDVPGKLITEKRLSLLYHK